MKHLGSGGMASVFLCEDERLGRKVAVKRLHADSPTDVEQRFRREAKLGASLNHPNVVSVFDTATDEDGVLIVMEYVEGHPLRQLLRHGPLRPEEVCRIVDDLGDALDHAHAQGVIHRDVKPSNVLIRTDGMTKLADLGIATAADDTPITRSGILLGTAAYMAPEQLDGRGAEPASDIYALAAIAFETLSGQKPREGKTPMEIAHSMATAGPPNLRDAWPRAPAAAARVLERGMALDPEDRPASGGAFARELTVALSGAPETTVALSEAPETQPPTRRFRRRGPAVGAGGAAAAGVAAGMAAARTTGPAAVRRDEQPTMPPRAPRRSRASGGRRRPNFAAVALALVFVALAIAAVVGAVTSGGDDKSASSGAESPQREPTKKKQQKAKDEPMAKEKPNAEEPAAEEPAAPAAPAPAEEQQPPADSATGAELNDQGFDLMNQGRYAEAIPILQRAVDSLSADTSDLTYAYALFNLGKSLRLAGRPDEAVPILEQRLKIPNQTETVRQELELAKQQAKGK